MSVIGQFNLGFIITTLDNNIYILDQHACDEKYKFEYIQLNTSIHIQPLLIPYILTNINNIQEYMISQNLYVFEQNGFRVRYVHIYTCIRATYMHIFIYIHTHYCFLLPRLSTFTHYTTILYSCCTCICICIS